MTIQKVGVPWSVLVHAVEIIRLESGPDRLLLQTNLPNPVFPFVGTLAIHVSVQRGQGPEWVRNNIPGCDVHMFDSGNSKDREKLVLAKHRKLI